MWLGDVSQKLSGSADPKDVGLLNGRGPRTGLARQELVLRLKSDGTLLSAVAAGFLPGAPMSEVQLQAARLWPAITKVKVLQRSGVSAAQEQLSARGKNWRAKAKPGTAKRVRHEPLCRLRHPPDRHARL